MPRRNSKTSSAARQKQRATRDASLPYDDWLVARLKDPAEAAAYVEAVIEQGDQAAVMLALRQVAIAQGGIGVLAKRAKLTREATYRILSNAGNPELRSLTAILAAAGLRISVRPAGAAERVARYRVAPKVAPANRPAGRVRGPRR